MARTTTIRKTKPMSSLRKHTANNGKKYYQGNYSPKHPEKYKGNPTNIYYRSKWELKLMKWLDSNKKVVQWGSEEISIPYINRLDNKTHRYIPDFIAYMKVNDINGNEVVKKYMLEVKPYKETKKPIVTSSVITESVAYQIKTYVTNISKWKAAREYCKNNDMEFVILTEKELFKKS